MTAQTQTNSGSADGELLRHDVGGIATLTLNRPAARNSLNGALMRALKSEIAAIHQDETVRVVVIAASGPAFCAGHDMRELRAKPDRDRHEAAFSSSGRIMLSLQVLPQPVIASVQGVATAAGCQLVASCDLAVAAESARFATPGVDIGLFCSTPQVALSRNVGRKAALQMLLTGESIDARTALLWGLVNRVVADADLAGETSALARVLASKSRHTLALGKAAFYRQIEMTAEDAYAYTSRVMAENMMARDAEEGIDAFLEKRKPVWSDK